MGAMPERIRTSKGMLSDIGTPGAQPDVEQAWPANRKFKIKEEDLLQLQWWAFYGLTLRPGVEHPRGHCATINGVEAVAVRPTS